MPSRAEGGANVVTEAAARGVPVLATRVAGNVGLLGPRHPGLFPALDARALARLLSRCETDPAFLRRLRASSRALARDASPSRERKAWARLLAELRLSPRDPEDRALDR